MTCKKCGAETLVEGAIYCASCGNRLDGKIQCNNCGQFNDGTNAFCVFCGTRIDGKTVCANCGELIEGAFCAHCGTAVSVAKQPKNKVNENSIKAKANATKAKEPKFLDRVFGLTAGGIALLGAVFALIFVFLIGFAVKARGNVEELDSLTLTNASNIYYFFGDAYKEMGEMETAFEQMLCKDLLMGDVYLYTIICTVISAVTLGCVVGFAVPAVIFYVRYATGKTEKMNSKWALLTIISFLGGVAMLYAQNYTSIKMSVGTEMIKVAMNPNGATMAGVVLCIVFTALWLGVKLVSYGGEWKNKDFIKKAVCVILSVCLLSALFVVWQHVSLALKIDDTAESANMSIGFAPAIYNLFFVSTAESMLTGGGIYQYESNLIAVYACNIVMIFVSVGGVVSIMGCLKSRFSAAEDKDYTGLVFGIIAFALTVVSLILLIIMQVNADIIFGGSTETTTEIGYHYGACIASLVLAGLNLAVSITQSVFKKQKME